MSDYPRTVRKNPCASCPYRRDAASGIWAGEEYDKLPAYDGDIPEQTSTAIFNCHQSGAEVCAGWAGHRNPAEMLAVRLGLIGGDLDPTILYYRTDVELFATGAEAATHGKKQLQQPSQKARESIQKIIRVRANSTHPITPDS